MRKDRVLHELALLWQIEHMNLTDNELTRVPTWIGSYCQAGAILLGGNQLTTIPNSIGAMGEVILGTINLSNNSELCTIDKMCPTSDTRACMRSELCTIGDVCLSAKALLRCQTSNTLYGAAHACYCCKISFYALKCDF